MTVVYEGESVCSADCLAGHDASRVNMVVQCEHGRLWVARQSYSGGKMVFVRLAPWHRRASRAVRAARTAGS